MTKWPNWRLWYIAIWVTVTVGKAEILSFARKLLAWVSDLHAQYLYLRLRKQQEAEEADREQRAKEEAERRKRLAEEKERRAKEEYQRRLEEMRRKQIEEEAKRMGELFTLYKWY